MNTFKEGFIKYGLDKGHIKPKKENKPKKNIIQQMNDYYGTEYIKVEENKPEDGKVYSLTGAKGTACIANGNTWKESEVKEKKI